ncbi:hypothetical protein ACIBBE_24575 [Streptomyces sp. NPDC051644]|uniref:hypothetical protein n=1 Tax=Streptomyces sp. NPDC051644 TaxID=3365666 RepID=UPI00379FDD33
MPITPAASNGTFSVTVTRPGTLGTVRVGPFDGEWSARGFVHALDRSVRGTGAPDGTTTGIAPYDPRLPHRCVPALDPAELARQMDREPDQAGFPDLFTRLVAHCGWEHAARAWLAARAHRGHEVETMSPPRTSLPSGAVHPPRHEEARMDADTIPTHITALAYTAPGPKLSQNDTAALLAHFWPAIEEHIRRQAAAETLSSPGCPVDGDTA